MRWEVKVNSASVSTRLRVRKGPSTSYAIVDWNYPEEGGVVVDSKVTNGATWYKWEGTEYWSCGTTSNGTKYLIKVKDLEEETKPDPTPPNPEPTQPETKDVTIEDLNYSITTTKFENNGSSNSDSSWYQPMMTYGNTSYGEVDYNVYSDLVIDNNIAAIKHNMDISYTTSDDVYDSIWSNGNSGYFSDLQKKMYNSFNRHKTAFPDKVLTKTFAYVFFTRPDLNILTVGSGTTNLVLNDENTGHDPKYKYLWENNPWCLKSLVSAGNPYHKFMVLLSNEALSFEVGDVVLKTMEHGETYNGNKIIYGRSDQESNAAGEMSIRYTDTVNLDIFKLHLVWTDYINKVSRGIFSPKEGYMKNRVLDYAASCYYFLCAADGSTILYWQKLTGVFPINTSENTFSWDSGTLLAKPEINIKYMYSFKSSMDMFSLYEFNELATSNSKRKMLLDGQMTYNNKSGDYGIQTGSTLTHCPRVWQTVDTEGNSIFRLIWVERS